MAKRKKTADRSKKVPVQKKPKYEKTGFKNRKPTFYILFIMLIGMLLVSTYFMFNPPNPGTALYNLESRGQSYITAGVTQVTLIDEDGEKILNTTNQIKATVAALNTVTVDTTTEVSDQATDKQIVMRSLVNATESSETEDKYFNFNSDMTVVWITDSSQTTTCHTIYDNEDIVEYFSAYMYQDAE